MVYSRGLLSTGSNLQGSAATTTPTGISPLGAVTLIVDRYLPSPPLPAHDGLPFGTGGDILPF